ncbi:MAG: hypothetical protein ACXABY_11055 [Candidatus Thorarchaeota archaeon]|jgi:hypothetical protein
MKRRRRVAYKPLCVVDEVVLRLSGIDRQQESLFQTFMERLDNNAEWTYGEGRVEHYVAFSSIAAARKFMEQLSNYGVTVDPY